MYIGLDNQGIVVRFLDITRNFYLLQSVSFLFNGHHRLFLWQKISQCIKPTTHLHLVPSLIMTGAILQLLLMPLWHTQGKLHFTFILRDLYVHLYSQTRLWHHERDLRSYVILNDCYNQAECYGSQWEINWYHTIWHYRQGVI